MFVSNFDFKLPKSIPTKRRSSIFLQKKSKYSNTNNWNFWKEFSYGSTKGPRNTVIYQLKTVPSILYPIHYIQMQREAVEIHVQWQLKNDEMVVVFRLQHQFITKWTHRISIYSTIIHILFYALSYSISFSLSHANKCCTGTTINYNAI